MKHYLIIITSIFFLSCDNNNINDKSKRNENWAWWIDAKTGKGQWIPLSENPTWDNGKYTKFYFNGAVYEKGKIENGRNIDTIFSFDINGKPFAYRIIKPDSIFDYFINNGSITIYRQNGVVSNEGIVQNHTAKSDKWISYFRNGNKRLVIDFAKDTGWQVTYFENGQVQDSSFHIKGYDTVFCVQTWYDNGNIAKIENWKDRLRHGSLIKYYQNGLMKDSCYFIKGKEEGIAKQWYENGQLHYYGEFKIINQMELLKSIMKMDK